MNAAFGGFFMSSEIYWDFPGSLVVKTSCASTARSIVPGQGTKILHAMWHGQKVKKNSKKKTNNKNQLDKKNEAKATTYP